MSSINGIIARAKGLYRLQVSNSVLVAVTGPGLSIHDAEAERRPGICPGLVLPERIGSQQWAEPTARSKRGKSTIGNMGYAD